MDFPSHLEKIMPQFSGEDLYHNENKPYDNAPLREQDRFLPIANIARIMKKSIPQCGKIAKDAKECVQECVSEFISFITSEASDKCQLEKRKTINGDDIIYAMGVLGFDSYIEPLKTYLYKYRDSLKTNDKASPIDTDINQTYTAQQLRLSDLGTQFLMGKISLTLNSLNNIESVNTAQHSENTPHSRNNNTTYLNSNNFAFNQSLPSIMEMTSMTSQVQNLQSPANGISLIDGSDSNNYEISHSDNHNQPYGLVDFHPSDNSSFTLTSNHNSLIKKQRKS